MAAEVMGQGELRVDDTRGGCRYRLSPCAEGKGGDGWLSDGHALLEAAAKRGLATLQAEDGRLYYAEIIGLSEGVARITFRPIAASPT